MRLTRYLSRVVATRIAAALAALTALVLLIEMLEAIRRMLGGTRGLGTVLTYLALRLPLAVDRLFPLAVLLGCALAFGTLARSNEMTILRSAGLSPLRFFRALWPVLLVCGIVNYLFEDHWAPAAERAFAAWWQDTMRQDRTRQDTAGQGDDDGGAAGVQWLRVGDQIVSVGRIGDEGRRLDGVTRYGRDAAGRLTVVARAKAAWFDGKGWRLQDDRAASSDGRRVAAGAIWPQGPSVENMRQMTLSLSRMTGAQARQALMGTWSGTGSAAHYRIVVQRSYAAFAIPLVMTLLAIPALHGDRRAGNLAYGMASSLGLGLAFLVVNGLFLSMGEASAIPAALAVWAAPLSFILLGLTAWLHFEERSR